MASSYPMLRYGSSGQEVRRLQQALNRAGYSLEVDGGFGEKTRAALMDYQRRAGMTPDGVAGSKTWASLGLQSAQDRLADLEKGYTPSRETQEARRSWEELAARQPGDYTSPYADRMEDLLRQMESREAFSYDPSRDEIFRRYARLYQRQGQTAMEDTLGQAAGLTGGYDSSYARQAGQQEYNRYMQELAALVPQLQQDAWDRYETQGQALLDQYKLLQGQDEDAYGQWRDRMEDWQDASRQARDRYESLEKQDYSNYLALMKYYASRAKQEQDAALAQQAVVIGPQLLRRGGGAAPQTPQQSGVPHQAPAQHHRVRSREIPAQGGGVLRREDIAVIHRRPGAGHGGPGVPVGDALVKLLLDPGVDDQLRQGILAIDRQQARPLGRVIFPDAGLDGHGHPPGQSGEDLLQAVVQLLGIGQQA